MCVCVLQIEQVSQLAALVQAQLEYHSRSTEILQQLSSKMEDRYWSIRLPVIKINQLKWIDVVRQTFFKMYLAFIQDKRSVQ